MTFLLFKINLLELELIRLNGDFSQGGGDLQLTCGLAIPCVGHQTARKVHQLSSHGGKMALDGNFCV